MAVARSRVAMKCAPQVFLLDQFRKGMFFRSFKFAAIFTQLRRNEIEIESAIKFGLIAHLRNFLCPSFLFRLGSGGDGARRYSFSVQPHCNARLRSPILCSLFPVK